MKYLMLFLFFSCATTTHKFNLDSSSSICLVGEGKARIRTGQKENLLTMQSLWRDDTSSWLLVFDVPLQGELVWKWENLKLATTINKNELIWIHQLYQKIQESEKIILPSVKESIISFNHLLRFIWRDKLNLKFRCEENYCDLEQRINISKDKNKEVFKTDINPTWFWSITASHKDQQCFARYEIKLENNNTSLSPLSLHLFFNQQ